MEATELEVVNRVADALLDMRVAFHDERQAGSLDVAPYLAGLKAARDAESAVEELRRQLGAEHSRAFEIATRADRSS